MSENPYQSPTAQIELQTKPPGHPLIAVAAGFLAYVISRTIFSKIVVYLIMDYSIGHEVLTTIGFVIRSLSALLGGFICAYITRENITKPIGILVFIDVFLGTLSLILTSYDWKLFYPAQLLSISMIMLGAWLFVRLSKSTHLQKQA